MKKKSKPTSKVYRTLPRGYKNVDVARNLAQAKALKRSYPKDANAIIVATPRNKVFPYHIASNNRLYG